ncbi:hypothetical protein BDV93DRAFT_4900 [Ceratobasidium sp. AG-I]|nr:hypothetical protein BDV93DRAFT_4900 [Ceratobasidium sp. AG-I]
MGEYASGSEAKLQIETTLSNKSEPEKDEVVVVSTRVRPNSKRKRLRESGEGVKAEDALLGPLMKDKSVEQAKDRMYPSVPSPPVPFPQGQPPGYYPMPFGYFPYPPPPLPPHAHPHAHAAAYASWSHQVHHCSTQQQHQHTHAPYPFPQSSLAPNQLTEASFGFMYGYAAMPHAPGASGSTGHSVWYPPGAHIPYPMPPVNQTEGALQVSPPKLEQVSSSQEEVPDSQERVPSSQEHEREKEKRNAQPGLVQPASEKRMRSPLPCPQVEPGPEAEPTRSMPAPENAAIPRPITPTNLKSNNIPHTPPVAAGPPSPAPKAPIFQRESSVIDIDSDSDDELAEYNAGEGSMRWEPPIKDEEDSDEDGGLDLSAEMDGSDDDILLLGKPTCIDGRPLKRRLRKSPGKADHKSRASPLKLRTL